MARGWESKSAEELAEQHEQQRTEAQRSAGKRAVSAGEAAQARARQLLELKRERILSEKTSHPARRTALQAALKEVEQELERLG